jgi:hypothetical protein
VDFVLESYTHGRAVDLRAENALNPTDFGPEQIFHIVESLGLPERRG